MEHSSQTPLVAEGKPYRVCPPGERPASGKFTVALAFTFWRLPWRSLSRDFAVVAAQKSSRPLGNSSAFIDPLLLCLRRPEAIRPARRNTVTRFARFTFMRSTALVTALAAAGLSLAVQMSAQAAPASEGAPKKTSETSPKKASEAAPKKQVPMPRARPVARSVVPKTTAPAATPLKEAAEKAPRKA